MNQILELNGVEGLTVLKKIDGRRLVMVDGEVFSSDEFQYLTYFTKSSNSLNKKNPNNLHINISGDNWEKELGLGFYDEWANLVENNQILLESEGYKIHDAKVEIENLEVLEVELKNDVLKSFKDSKIKNLNVEFEPVFDIHFQQNENKISKIIFKSKNPLIYTFVVQQKFKNLEEYFEIKIEYQNLTIEYEIIEMLSKNEDFAYLKFLLSELL